MSPYSVFSLETFWKNSRCHQEV